MTPPRPAFRQKTLAIAAAVLGLGVFVAANVHLVMAAFRSAPACTAPEGAAQPARRVC